MSELTIADIRARAVIAPLRRPIRTASGAIEASPLLLLDVITEQGITGSAYLFAYTPLMLKPLRALVGQLLPLLRGQAVVPLARQQQLEQQFRLLGLQGLLGMVVSTLDMALWDALGKAANQPVVRLLGGRAPAGAGLRQLGPGRSGARCCSAGRFGGTGFSGHQDQARRRRPGP